MIAQAVNRVAVLGAGAWGTALARVLAASGHEVRLWTRRAEHASELRKDRENVRHFPGFALPDNVLPSSDVAEVLRDVSDVLVVVPSHAFRETLSRAKPELVPDMRLVSASKGIETGTLMLMSEVVEDVLGAQFAKRTGYLSGPSFAKEVALGQPTNVVVAAADEALATELQTLIATERLRVYTSVDPIGVEVGGALKNVIAIAAGASDGLGFGHNTRAAVITRGVAEIARLAVEKGGNVLTLAGLSGLGDLILTCTGELSRNRTLGFQLGRGLSTGAAVASLSGVAEGINTAKSAYDLSKRLNLDLPITTEVYRVLFEAKPVERAVHDLLSRPLKKEWS